VKRSVIKLRPILIIAGAGGRTTATMHYLCDGGEK